MIFNTDFNGYDYSCTSKITITIGFSLITQKWNLLQPCLLQFLSYTLYSQVSNRSVAAGVEGNGSLQFWQNLSISIYSAPTPKIFYEKNSSSLYAWPSHYMQVIKNSQLTISSKKIKTLKNWNHASKWVK